MADRGPVPKRSDQRRRTNKRPDDVDKAGGADVFEPPEPDSEWHPIALAWFRSLAESGQSAFYEPSDWATAVFVAEAMSRELEPQGLVYKGEITGYHTMVVKASMLSALMSAMSSLMVTEGDRRRMRLELQRPKPGESEGEDGNVSYFDDAARRLRGGAG